MPPASTRPPAPTRMRTASPPFALEVKKVGVAGDEQDSRPRAHMQRARARHARRCSCHVCCVPNNRVDDRWPLGNGCVILARHNTCASHHLHPVPRGPPTLVAIFSRLFLLFSAFSLCESECKIDLSLHFNFQETFPRRCRSVAFPSCCPHSHAHVNSPTPQVPTSTHSRKEILWECRCWSSVRCQPCENCVHSLQDSLLAQVV